MAKAINIALSPQFATWPGTVPGLTAKPVLIAETDDQLHEAEGCAWRDTERRCLAGGISAWTQAGLETDSMCQMAVPELYRRQGIRILDVRRKCERTAGPIQGARLWPLEQFSFGYAPLDKSVLIAVECRSGYRGTTACRLWREAGYPTVTNVLGGFDAWAQTNCRMTTDEDHFSRLCSAPGALVVVTHLPGGPRSNN